MKNYEHKITDRNFVSKTITFLTVALLILAFTSCSNDDGPTLLEVESKTMTNLYAPQSGGQGQPISGEFTKFDFSTGEATTSDTEWDIAFRGTTIIINGGESLGTTDEPNRTGNAAAYIANGTLASVTEVNISLLVQDTTNGYAIPTGSGNGWYLYNPQAFLISPIAGKVLVFKTRNNRYAKVEILSYYKDAPANPNVQTDESRYYTFSYIYNPNENITTF